MSEQGFMWAMGPCLACGQVFAFDPERVPSLRWPQPDGPREPVCSSCMARANARRKAAGLPPHPILPGAYPPFETGD
jgi:hypothetical protein